MRCTIAGAESESAESKYESQSSFTWLEWPRGHGDGGVGDSGGESLAGSARKARESRRQRVVVRAKNTRTPLFM